MFVDERSPLDEKLGEIEEMLVDIQKAVQRVEDFLDLEFVRIGDVAKMIGVDRKYVNEIIENSPHRLRVYRFGAESAHRRFLRTDVLQWIEKHAEEGP